MNHSSDNYSEPIFLIYQITMIRRQQGNHVNPVNRGSDNYSDPAVTPTIGAAIHQCTADVPDLSACAAPDSVKPITS